MQNDIKIKLLEDAHDHSQRTIKARTQKLYDSIRDDYKKLTSKKKHDVPIYTSQYIIRELAEKYFKSPKTIENIVYHRV